jgi:hypothetical protein
MPCNGFHRRGAAHGVGEEAPSRRDPQPTRTRAHDQYRNRTAPFPHRISSRQQARPLRQDPPKLACRRRRARLPQVGERRALPPEPAGRLGTRPSRCLMARPPLAIGTAGKIRVTGSGSSHRARALFRDRDGVTRPVERSGRSAGAARTALGEAIRDRKAKSADGDLGAESTVAELLSVWWRRKLAISAKLSAGTKSQLRGHRPTHYHSGPRGRSTSRSHHGPGRPMAS